ncbi:MAG: preprotein translocase subunit YajC [bacterium]
MMLTAIAHLQAAQSAGAGIGSTLLLVGPMILIFYFFLIKPQNDARKKHLEMVSSVRRGDKVVTGGGLIGKVVKVAEGSEEITVELAEGVQVQVLKSSLTDVTSKTRPKEQAEKSDKK